MGFGNKGGGGNVGVGQKDLDLASEAASVREGQLMKLLDEAGSVELPDFDMAKLVTRTAKGSKKAERKLTRNLRRIDRSIAKPRKQLRRGVAAAAAKERQAAASRFGIEKTMKEPTSRGTAGAQVGPFVTQSAAVTARAQHQAAELSLG